MPDLFPGKKINVPSFGNLLGFLYVSDMTGSRFFGGGGECLSCGFHTDFCTTRGEDDLRRVRSVLQREGHVEEHLPADHRRRAAVLHVPGDG